MIRRYSRSRGRAPGREIVYIILPLKYSPLLSNLPRAVAKPTRGRITNSLGAAPEEDDRRVAFQFEPSIFFRIQCTRTNFGANYFPYCITP